ncbi:polyisoprenoid-binding protein [Noviherbaspirillum cavernae]|uniref:Polyisoprenoid-binding protein n=1 Tax=Noviherbaspirillum cavernae TaxID=2320862 RepID=A0A418X3Y7_9BURK|nr:YceI family protein [Noviherbaspirillum cavernae]RJG07111.1 polyisoprenoid-binding protein [Noviherbaspirillum cavernae]
MKLKHIAAALLAVSATSAFADVYNIEPNHTYPSFEADHLGISVWRGKFTKTSGKISLDRAAKTGTVDIAIEANSLDFGHTKMNDHAKSKDMFNVEQFPTITYKGKAIKFDGDKPVAVEGDLTMLGVTKPVTLAIGKFKCIQHPMFKREVCGADATAEFKRTDFGLNYGTPRFASEVKLAIQVEAIKAD